MMNQRFNSELKTESMRESQMQQNPLKKEFSMQKDKILIVDDEAEMRDFLGEILNDHYEVLFAQDAKQALEMANSHLPEAIVLDVVMPGVPGSELVKTLRENKKTELIPVLMVTGSDELNMRIQCYNYGADDFIAKPFHPKELLSRVLSKIQRAKQQRKSEGQQITLGNIKLDLINHTLLVDGVDMAIGTIEFKILHCLLAQKGQLVTRQALNDFVWGQELPSDRAMDPHITALRKKLNPSKVELRTIYGKGYSVVEKHQQAV